jgi:hypothetical protein
MSKRRLGVFRDIVVFQAKLLVDGLRDLLLSPLSIGAALIDLLIPGDDGGKRFYAVVRFGRRTERWINLFGAADRRDPDVSPQGADALLNEIEAFLRDPNWRDTAKADVQALVERLRRGRGPNAND